MKLGHETYSDVVMVNEVSLGDDGETDERDEGEREGEGRGVGARALGLEGARGGGGGQGVAAVDAHGGDRHTSVAAILKHIAAELCRASVRFALRGAARAYHHGRVAAGHRGAGEGNEGRARDQDEREEVGRRAHLN